MVHGAKGAKPAEDKPAQSYPFSPQEALEFMQRMWNPLGLAMPGFQPAAAGGAATAGAGAAAPGAVPGMPFPNPATMFPVLDPVELERKIAELRVVENWLTMSLSMMQMSIKTLELQKASLEAMRAGSTPR
ncbi:MAG: hypothetical protein IT522_11930 [Burkholderiales bacterium]|nr:hypothetical protein [Burkholderiales bacterium]